METKITVQDLMLLIGQKEVEIALMRQRIAELEAKLKEQEPKE